MARPPNVQLWRDAETRSRGSSFQAGDRGDAGARAHRRGSPCDRMNGHCLTNEADRSSGDVIVGRASLARRSAIADHEVAIRTRFRAVPTPDRSRGSDRSRAASRRSTQAVVRTRTRGSRCPQPASEPVTLADLPARQMTLVLRNPPCPGARQSGRSHDKAGCWARRSVRNARWRCN